MAILILGFAQCVIELVGIAGLIRVLSIIVMTSLVLAWHLRPEVMKMEVLEKF